MIHIQNPLPGQTVIKHCLDSSFATSRKVVAEEVVWKILVLRCKLALVKSKTRSGDRIDQKAFDPHLRHRVSNLFCVGIFHGIGLEIRKLKIENEELVSEIFVGWPLL